jgi:hypothetical protein
VCRPFGIEQQPYLLRMGPPVVPAQKTTIRLVRVQEGLSLWWLGTAAMAVARVEPGEAEVGADAGEIERRRIVTGAIRLPGKGEA